MCSPGDVAAAYARRSVEYADRFGSVSAAHPADRELVDRWVAGVDGRVLDAGCGPGHWTQHLAGRGADVHGVDLVPEFVAHARSRYPGVRFDVGDIDALAEPDGSVAGILCWYSTIHHPAERMPVALAEIARTLRLGGTLLLGYFDADGASVEAFDHVVAPAYRWPLPRMRSALEQHGLEVVETHRRTGPGHRPHAAVLCRRTGESARPSGRWAP